MGDAYKRTLKSFPVLGFIQATQQHFLVGYRQCNYEKDKKKQIKNCLHSLNERTKQLDESLTAKIFSDVKGRYDPSDVVLQIVLSGNKTDLAPVFRIP